MTRDLVNWKNWDDDECKSAWNKLIEQFSSQDIMYAFYGGILSGDIKVGLSIVGNRGHEGPKGIVEIDYKEASEICENWIDYRPKISLSALKEMVENYNHIQENYDEVYKGIFTKEELEYVHSELFIKWPEQTKVS